MTSFEIRPLNELVISIKDHGCSQTTLRNTMKRFNVTPRHEVIKLYWENGAQRHAWYSIAIKLASPPSLHCIRDMKVLERILVASSCLDSGQVQVYSAINDPPSS